MVKLIILVTFEFAYHGNDQQGSHSCHDRQGCIFRLRCSHPELTEDLVLTNAYVKILRTVTRNAVNKSV